ncbi:carbonic anhydrase [Stereum hirsutum FP-91666 SS1]|uniref:carbonic anhydrase n=1 Tax=Stereum hirsutum (strain FP-91666) TaxID=721885 RepID=UPI0004449EA9|nr:carbonic anhydrase [Stereum hirsutum FP-91666 SS1]EIM83401.1 carbonic anhydrase [Stereum hirsutum FP-91666 SS1]
MSAASEFPAANNVYVENFGDKGSLPLPPGKKLIVVTCMDSRIDVMSHLGLKEGDAHIIRNAGGVAIDAIRSIIISQRLLGTREIAIFHHTGCGMVTFKTPQLREIVASSAPEDKEVAKRLENIDFHEFDDVEESTKDDVKFLKAHPLLLKETTVTGWVYEVETGKIRQVA